MCLCFVFLHVYYKWGVDRMRLRYNKLWKKNKTRNLLNIHICHIASRKYGNAPKSAIEQLCFKGQYFECHLMICFQLEVIYRKMPTS